MDISVAEGLGLLLKQLKNPIPLTLGDNRPHMAGPITHRTTPLSLRFGEHTETVIFLLTKLTVPAILGLPWMDLHNPRVDWRSRTFFLMTPPAIAVDIALPWPLPWLLFNISRPFLALLMNVREFLPNSKPVKLQSKSKFLLRKILQS